MSSGLSTVDYIFSAIFVGLIFLQVRGRRITVRFFLLPVIIVAVAADKYLRGFPTGGNNVILVVICAAIGLGLGIVGALVTSIRRAPDGHPVAKAGFLAVLLWILGTGSRLALGIYASNGGAETIATFARAHDLNVKTALPTALILMALGEVLGRYGLLGVRAWSVLGGHGGPPDSASGGTARSPRSSTSKW